MSTRPQSLIDVSKYIQDKTGVPASNMSIRAARSSRGFHAGKAEIFGPNGQGKKDYSVKDARNLAGLTDASSAIDIKLPLKTLRALTAHLVDEGKAGNLLFEVIGPDATGKANYWSVKTGWLPKPNLAPASHSWHIHLGFWRDTESADRIAPFRSFFEQPSAPAPEPQPAPEEDPAPSITDVEDLQAENDELKAKIAAATQALS